MTEIIKRPDEGGEPPSTYYPGPYPHQVSDTPEWATVRPPFDPNSEIQRHWSTAMTPLRGAAIAFLWLTLTWWRFALSAATVLLIWVVIVGQGGG
jgi:hypothetical protein